jgi:hypothetical protein
MVGRGRQLIAWRAAPYPNGDHPADWQSRVPGLFADLGFVMWVMVGNQYGLKEAVVRGRFFNSQRGIPVVAPRMQSRG